MIDRPKSRDALVMDALEAELGPGVDTAASGDPRQGARPGSGASEDARLAELARIVGQNDRFRDLLRVPADSGRQSASYDDAPRQWEGQPANNEGAAHLNAYVSAHRDDGAAYQGHTQGQTQGYAPGYAAADGRDAAVQWDAAQPGYQAQQSYPGAYAAPAQDWAGNGQAGGYYADNAGHVGSPDPLQAIEGSRLRRRAPSRRPLYSAVAVIALCVSASAGYFALRGPGSDTGGEAAIVKADSSPVKVKPPAENAAEPAATKEIYEQLAKPTGNTKVVANNEQPVDVEQTLRQQRAAAVAAGKLPSEVNEDAGTFGAPGLQPLPTHASNRDPRSGLGEPRKVRTVSIGPDGKVRDNGQQVASAPVTAPVKAPALAAAPRAGAATPATTTAPAQAPKVAKQEHRVPSTAVDTTTTGSVGSAATAPAPKPKPTVAAVPVSRGGFSVQLGAPGSDQEAKTLAASLKRKYPALAGHNTAVVKAQTNGKTIYRLRVPGLSRDSANNLCQQLKSVGGSCFVAQG